MIWTKGTRETGWRLWPQSGCRRIGKDLSVETQKADVQGFRLGHVRKPNLLGLKTLAKKSRKSHITVTKPLSSYGAHHRVWSNQEARQSTLGARQEQFGQGVASAMARCALGRCRLVEGSGHQAHHRP